MEERLPPMPDWTSLVFRELRNRLDGGTDGGNLTSIREMFSAFDTVRYMIMKHRIQIYPLNYSFEMSL